MSGEKRDDRYGRLEQAKVGNSLKGKNHGFVTEHVGTNKSKSHHDMGLVQSRRAEGVATHFPYNTRKQKEGVASTVRPSMDGMGSPLVDIFVRKTDKRGSTGF